MTATSPGSAMTCRFCRSAAGDVVLDAGLQPASDLFPPADDPGPDPVHPLRMWLCADCGLAQLIEDPTAPEEPRGVEPEALVRQARDAVATMAARGFLRPGLVVTEYGSPHGGGWIDLVTDRGLTEAAPGQRVDVIVDNIGMMHDADQAAGLAERVARLNDGGTLLFHFHSLAAIVRGRQWNALRHGHYAYYSTPSIVGMLAKVGLTTVTAVTYPLYGGTVLLAAVRGGRPDESVAEVIEQELAVGVLEATAVGSLQDACTSTADDLAAFLTQEHAAGRTVLGYSAASRSVALLNRAGVGVELLAAIGDASPAKTGRRLPGSGVPVVEPAALAAARPDTVILFVDDLLPEVRTALPEIERAGGRWLVMDELAGATAVRR